MDFDTGGLDDGIAGLDELIQVVQSPQPHVLTNSVQDLHIEPGKGIHIACIPVHNNSPEVAVDSPFSLSVAGTTKSSDFQTASRTPPVEFAIQHGHKRPIQLENNGPTLRKAKRARLMLDVRTELTDEELKVSVKSTCLSNNLISPKATRMYYLDKQNTIRFELEFKRFEKRQDDLIHSLLWDAPGSGKPPRVSQKNEAEPL